MANKYLDDDGLLYFWQKIKNKFAALNSPAFTGTPTAPTATSSDNSTQIATTAFVQSAVSGANSPFTGATASADGASGLVPAPLTGQQAYLLKGSGSWGTLAASDIPSLPASKITSGTLGVARGGTGVGTLGAGLVYHATSGTGALSIATASNIVSALGSTAVNRATADASGNVISDTYALKTEIAGMYKYKGSVASASNLPNNPSTGDVYNIESASIYGGAGANVAWNGSSWDSLGEIFQITTITNGDIDTIVAS